MSYLEAFILGVLQGVAEFLPISSSGHLFILKELFGIADVPRLFDVMLHISTLFVIVIVFRKRIGSIIMSLLHYLQPRKPKSDIDKANLFLVLMILLVSVFTALIGFFLHKMDFQYPPQLVCVFFLVTALLLVLSHRLPRLLSGLSVPSAIIIGIFQGLGVLPGISRSGITISTAISCGIKREEAGEFSFLIAIPAIIGALLLELKDSADLFQQVSLPVLAFSFAVSFVIGLISLLLLLKLIKKQKLVFFSIYLAIIGIGGIIYFTLK